MAEREGSPCVEPAAKPLLCSPLCGDSPSRVWRCLANEASSDETPREDSPSGMRSFVPSLRLLTCWPGETAAPLP